MTTYNSDALYYTPERESKLKTNNNVFSTALAKPSNDLEVHSEVRAANFSQQFGRKEVRDVSNHEKMVWFQEKTEELRRYLNGNLQINKKHIQDMFGWGDQYATYQGTQQKILKHLSFKVKALIKENHQLRGNCQSEELVTLRRQNDQLKAAIDQFHRGQATRELILSEENQYLRQYIQRHKQDIQRQRIVTNHRNQENEEVIYLTNQHSIQSQQNVTNLRKYIMNYINTIVEANDHQFEAQEKYIQSLQKRISKLNTFQNLIEHMHFEKKVRLQESNRKTKNFSIGTPKIIGDRFQYELQQQPKQQPLRKQEKQPYFKSRIKQQNQPLSNRSAIKPNKDDSVKNSKQILTLVTRSAQLQQQLSALRQKYDNEVQNHIRDSCERQQLLTIIQKINAQKNQLKYQLNNLKEKLIVAQAKYNHFQNSAKIKIDKQDAEFHDQRNISIKDELNLIKTQLEACGIHNFEQIQRQIAQIIHQRDFLKKQLTSLQNTLTKNTKFSSTHKELFLLRQKNNQLQYNCRFYQDQIAQYQKQLRLISEQNQHQLAKDISNDFKEMRKDDFQGLSWARQAHYCMVNSINRLQHIQNRLKYNLEQ